MYHLKGSVSPNEYTPCWVNWFARESIVNAKSIFYTLNVKELWNNDIAGHAI